MMNTNDDMVTIPTKVCMFCNKAGTVTLTKDQHERFLNRTYIQDALPEVSQDVREMLITGTHGACWDRFFPTDDDE